MGKVLSFDEMAPCCLLAAVLLQNGLLLLGEEGESRIIMAFEREEEYLRKSMREGREEKFGVFSLSGCLLEVKTTNNDVNGRKNFRAHFHFIVVSIKRRGK